MHGCDEVKPSLSSGVELRQKLFSDILAFMSKKDPFEYFKTSPDIIKLAVMYYVRFPLSIRQIEDILHELFMKELKRIDKCLNRIFYHFRRDSFTVY